MSRGWDFVVCQIQQLSAAQGTRIFFCLLVLLYLPGRELILCDLVRITRGLFMSGCGLDVVCGGVLVE